MKDAPFIHVRLTDGAPVATGLTNHTVGRRNTPGFAAWRWDGRVLTVENCRYGIRPLFYYSAPREICVSTSIEALLARGAPLDLDTEALAAFLRLNWFVGDDTPFKAVRLVPPAAHFRWDGALSLQSTLHHVPANGLERSVAMDEFIARFRRAIERDYVDGAVVPLSGGRDSRHILFELCRLGRPRLCVTVKDAPPWPDPNDNTQLARQLATMFGIEHIVLDYVQDIVAAERFKNELTSLCNLENSWFAPVNVRLFQEGGRVFDGVAGDYLSAGGGLDQKAVELLHTGQIDALANYMVVRRRLPLMTFLQDGDAFPLEAAQARVRRELERHLAAANPIGSFFFWNRIRRGNSSFIAGRDVCTPFLDYDVFDLLTGLGVENFTDRKFHTEAIHRAFPQYAHIPFESKKKEPASNPHGYLMRNWLKLLGHLLWRGGGVINMRYVVPRLAFYALLGKAKPVWYDSASIWAIQLKEMVARYQLSTRDGTRASTGCSSL